MNGKSILFQIVIGGINVDLIAKGKTKKLLVGLLKITFLCML